jgi:hypothetical protein
MQACPDTCAIPEERRRYYFRLLVVAQDLDMTVVESRQMLADRFGLTDAQVQRIEQEGITGNWPPL